LKAAASFAEEQARGQAAALAAGALPVADVELDGSWVPVFWLGRFRDGFYQGLLNGWLGSCPAEEFIHLG
jgi:hypothetical protein